MGYASQAQIKARRLNLVIRNPFKGFDLASTLDRVTQQLRGQDPGCVLKLSRLGRRK